MLRIPFILQGYYGNRDDSTLPFLTELHIIHFFYSSTFLFVLYEFLFLELERTTLGVSSGTGMLMEDVEEIASSSGDDDKISFLGIVSLHLSWKNLLLQVTHMEWSVRVQYAISHIRRP